MPYYRKRYNRKYKKRSYPKRKTGFMGKASNALTIASRALAVANMVKGMLNVEYKHVDTSVSATLAATFTSTFLYGPIPLGDTTNERNGKSIEVKSHNLRGILTRGASATVAVQIVRIVVWQIRENNGGDRSALIVNSANGVFENQSVIPFRTLTDTKDFIILMDRTYRLTADNPSFVVKNFHKFRPNSFKIKWQDTNITGNMDVVYGKQTYISYITDATVNFPTFNWQSRLRYIDN